MKIKYFIIFFIALTLFGKNALSEELFSSSLEVPKQDQFESVKTEVSHLVEDNKKLEVEYSLIYKEFEDLLNQVGERTNEVDGLEKTTNINLNDRKNNRITNTNQQGNPNDILVLESRINYLKTRLGNLEDQNSARKMQIDALKNQKGDLEIEVKMKDYLSQENDQSSTDKLNALKADIQKIEEEEKVAVNRIAEIEKEKQIYPQRINELTQKNKELKDKISDLEKRKDFKSRENANLRDKKLLEELLAERAVSVRQEEKAKLEQSLKKFESDYNQLDQQVSSKLQTKDQNREILKNLIQVDKENQDLRDRIGSLKNKIGQLDQK